MSEKQKTIRQPIFLKGWGLHTGCEVEVQLKPSAEGTGIQFQRIDLPEQPIIKATYENAVTNPTIPRCTSISKSGATIHTVEHLLSVLSGLGIDNLLVEINGPELPGLDGSGLEFLKAIQKAGTLEQSQEREY
ncbi:MAG: UDP-3-O-acyl-N-acetylglucosamine deacetylase, partial [Candidatus Omnitrophica bacterium]|nr:UDP-3-O-acyl-N-acetylglucosamine deacetylase [Candidatus Omnitrophota bacterium]